MTSAVLRTSLCDRLGIDYPVMLAGMGPTIGDGPRGVAGAELVAAVSNAGGLGVLGATGLEPEELEREIVRIRELTPRPFGVDILIPAMGTPLDSGAASGETRTSVDLADPELRRLLPEEQRAVLERIRAELGLPEPGPSSGGLLSFAPAGQVEVIAALGVPVLATGLGNPAPYSNRIHDAGGLVMSLVGTPAAAAEVVEGGADVVVAQGSEAGGHTGRIGTMALLPQVLDSVGDVPVVAAGGIGDGRGLAAALALGCAGAWCGTVFIATKEAELDAVRKRRILTAGADSTRVTRLYSGKTMRNVTNDLIEAWERSGAKALPMGLQSLLVADVLAAARKAGRTDLLMNAAGQICGIVKEVKPAAQVLDEMVTQAAEILARDLPRRVEATPAG